MRRANSSALLKRANEENEGVHAAVCLLAGSVCPLLSFFFFCNFVFFSSCQGLHLGARNAKGNWFACFVACMGV